MAKKLKLGKNKMLLGVCGGIAEYFKLDPAIVRILWALLTVLSIGAGIIVYIIAWVLMRRNK